MKMLLSRPLSTLSILLLPCLAHAEVPQPPTIDASSYILFDPQSSQILAEHAADLPVEPASITKVMTAYIAFDELRQGHVKPDDEVLISEKAWRTEGSRTFVEVGKRVRFEDLLHGMIIQSGNDATVAIAEHIAGDEGVFAELMNKYAARLGMKHSHFMNASGLPHAEHTMTAHDIALLSQALIRDFPEGYKLFSEREFSFGHRGQINQQNRNLLLDMDPSADGIKTGHTSSAGYCLAASSVREGRRLIAVVMGTQGTRQRAQASKALLDYGFRFYENVTLFGPEKPVARLALYMGDADSIDVGTLQPFIITVPRDQAAAVQITPQLPTHAVAPLAQGAALGQVSITLDGKPIRTLPVVALQAAAEGGFVSRAIDSLRLWWND